MTGLNTKTIALETLLTATNTKLDAIIDLMSAAPTPPTATLDDLLAILQDIHTDTMSIDGKLLTIRNSITDNLVPELVDIHTDTSSMDGKLLAIRNALIAPGEDDIPDDSGLLWNVFRLRKAVATASYEPEGIESIQLTTYEFYSLFNTLMAVANARLSSIENTLFYSTTNLGLNVTESTQEYTGYLFDSLNWLGLISGATGVPIDADNRNVIQLLALIADKDCCVVPITGQSPLEQCEDAFVSNGMILVPETSLWAGSYVATWPDTLPSELSFGSAYDFGVFGVELIQADGDWTGYSLYAASSAPTFGLASLDPVRSFYRYPTNTWLSIAALTGGLSAYVEEGNALRVYLCNAWEWTSSGGPWGDPPPPLPTTWDDCIDLSSTSSQYYYLPGTFTASMQTIQFSAIPGIGCTTSHSFGTDTEGFDISCSVALGDFHGATIELLSGTAPVIMIWVYGGARDTANLNSIGDVYTIPSATDSLLITNTSNISFSVRICPPTP